MNAIDYFQVGKLYQNQTINTSLFSNITKTNFIGRLKPNSIITILEIRNNNIKAASNLLGWFNKPLTGWFTCPQWEYEKYFKQVIFPEDI